MSASSSILSLQSLRCFFVSVFSRVMFFAPLCHSPRQQTGFCNALLFLVSFAVCFFCLSLPAASLVCTDVAAKSSCLVTVCGTATAARERQAGVVLVSHYVATYFIASPIAVCVPELPYRSSVQRQPVRCRSLHCLHLSACPIWLFFHFISRLFSLLSSTPFLPCYFLASFFAVPRSFFVDFVSLFLHYPSLAICGNISKRCFELMPAER